MMGILVIDKLYKHVCGIIRVTHYKGAHVLIYNKYMYYKKA